MRKHNEEKTQNRQTSSILSIYSKQTPRFCLYMAISASSSLPCVEFATSSSHTFLASTYSPSAMAAKPCTTFSSPFSFVFFLFSSLPPPPPLGKQDRAASTSPRQSHSSAFCIARPPRAAV